MNSPEAGVRADADVDDAVIITESLSQPERFAVIFDRYFPEVHRYVERRLGTDAVRPAELGRVLAGYAGLRPAASVALPSRAPT